jgi:hypothetical protein
MYRINEVAHRVGLSQKRIREYEKEGLIKPEREPRTNNRIYSEFEVSQIQRISRLIHERGFTVACLRNILVLAPCWNVFGCMDKEACPAYQNPHEDCWKVMRDQPEFCGGPCERCAVYLNRHLAKKGVLERTGTK